MQDHRIFYNSFYDVIIPKTDKDTIWKKTTEQYLWEYGYKNPQKMQANQMYWYIKKDTPCKVCLTNKNRLMSSIIVTE